MEDTCAQAKQYCRSKIRLTVVQLVLTAAFLIVMVLSGASVFVRDLAKGCSPNFYLQVSLYLVIFSLIYELIFIGLDFYGWFLLEHKFGLSSQTVSGWLKKSLKKWLLSLALLLATGEVLYFFLRRFPDHWWLLTMGAWVLFTIVLGKITPVLIIPLFYKCTPLANKELKERLLRLSRNCGLRVEQVFEVELSRDTRKANAAVAGFGKGRRILLGDTLLKGRQGQENALENSGDYSDEEIEAVFAHELGHIRLFHTWKILTVGALISLVGFYLAHLLFKTSLSFFGIDQIYDIAGFALLALIFMLIGLLFMPIQNGLLRYLEKQADLFAVEHMENPRSFASAMTKLAQQNLIDPSPSRLVELLFYDHPPISKRLGYGNGRQREAGPMREKS